MKHFTIKKCIITIALAITSALFVVFGLCMPKKTNVVHAASVGASDFRLDDMFLIQDTASYDATEYSLLPTFRYSVGTDYSAKLGTVNRGHIKWSISEGYTDRTETTAIYIVRTDDFSLYTSSVKGELDIDLVPDSSDYKDILENYNLYKYPSRTSVKDGGVGTLMAGQYRTTKVDVNKKYYYFLVLMRKTVDKGKVTTNTQFTQLAKSTNYIYTSYRELCEQDLKSNRFDNYKLEEKYNSNIKLIKSYRYWSDYSTDEGNVNIVLKYKNTINRNADEIDTVTENYQVDNLKSLSKTYVYNTVMQLCGKSSLSDFNVVRQEVGYTVNGDSDSAFLQDEYTLLEANGYEYEFNKKTNQGELTITYGDFAAKDFTLTVRSNDDLHSVLFIRSGDIKTAGGTTTITFDTSNIKTRLSNNFNWNVDNTDFNNYVFSNPHGSGVTFKKNLTGTDVTSITITTADTNLLADCSLRLEIQVVPPVELTVTVKYLHLSYENGEITEEWKTYPLTEKIWSSPNYTKINKVAFYDGDSDIGISAQGDFIDENIYITDNDGNQIERLTYDGVMLSASDNTTATAMITVKYIRNPLFRVYDSFTDDYYFVKPYGNMLSYSGSDFIVEHDGYRVKSIESENLNYARIGTQDGIPDWNNAKVYVLCQLAYGYIMPLKITYSDKWQVNVEYLENYYRESGGKKNATGFAVKKTYGKEVKVKGADGTLAFADINHPTINEILKFLGKSSEDDLTVITFGAVDKDNIKVSCVDDVFTIKLSYGRAILKQIQVDGEQEFLNIELTNWQDWVDGFGKDWTILVLNTNANIAFDSEFDVDPKDLYGYFYVVTYKEQVKNLDSLFSGYTSDGCRSFFSCKKVEGDAVYKTCQDMGFLPSLFCLGINKLIQAGKETKESFMGTYYSYFLFVDGSSMLPYAANNKADSYFDTDSAVKNTFENVGESISNWWKKGGAVVKFIKILLIVLAVLLIAAIVIKFLDFVWGVTDKHKRK